ncbi:MAG: serine/threonine-protein kinase [Candidatus Limnocylindrales bacterium]|jgi:serine/threonine-protein kinase
MTGTIQLKRKWTLGAQIGGGGFGRVFEATSDGGQTEALKVVHKELGAERELLFVDLGGVRNVVPIVESGETDDDWILVMPRAEKSLRQHLENAGPALMPDQAIPILVDVAQTLADLDERGIVHRDLKPENVLLLDGHWCVADFGIARYADKTTAKDTWKHAWTGAYNAPERWLDQRATSAADVYSFGIMAYEIFTGHRPFDGPDLREQHLKQEPPPPTISSALSSLVLECLYKPPQARPPAANLVLRLQKASQPTSGALARLQLANQAVVVAQSKAAAAASAADQEKERRAGLFAAANGSLKAIIGLMRAQIAEAAPAATPIADNRGLLGVELNGARLLVSEPRQVSRTNWDRWPPVFDVVGASTIRLVIPQTSAGYTGRSHSLWFCDGITEGRYRWFELAFWIMGGRATDNPFALDPGDKAGEAFAAGITLHHIARGPTAIDQGDAEAFIERWLEWFALASLGQLVQPMGMPEMSGVAFRK